MKWICVGMMSPGSHSSVFFGPEDAEGLAPVGGHLVNVDVDRSPVHVEGDADAVILVFEVYDATVGADGFFEFAKGYPADELAGLVEVSAIHKKNQI